MHRRKYIIYLFDENDNKAMGEKGREANKVKPMFIMNVCNVKNEMGNFDLTRTKCR